MIHTAVSKQNLDQTFLMMTTQNQEGTANILEEIPEVAKFKNKI